MRILQVAPYFPPYPGGQERYVRALSQALAEQGHEVKVLTSKYPPDTDPTDTQGVEVIRVKPVARILRNPLLPKMLTREHLAEWADVVHCHNEHATSSNIVAYWKQRMDFPAVLTCHGQLRFGNKLADAVESIYSRTLGSWTLQQMDRVIALSRTDERFLVDLGVEDSRTRIIPNAVDSVPSRDDDAVRRFRDSYGLDSHPLILFVGPMLHRKAPQTLVRAMCDVTREHPDAKALFTGAGGALGECRKLAQDLDIGDRVIFTDHVTDEELDAAYHAASLLAFTSTSEGLPTTILEAMGAGLPVVAARLGPLEDWFSDVASIVEADPDAVAEGITSLLDDPEKRRSMSKAGERYVKERFTWERVSRDIVDVYESVL